MGAARMLTWRYHGPPIDLDSLTVYSPEQYTQITETIRTHDRAQDQLDVAKNELTRLCTCIEVGDAVKNEAVQVYQRIIRTNLVNNYAISDLTAATVYAACCEHRVPRTFSDVYLATFVLVDGDHKDLFEGYDRVDPVMYDGCAVVTLSRENTIKRVYKQICDLLGRTHLPIGPEKFVQRYCDELGLGTDVEEFVRVTIDTVGETDVTGKDSGTIVTGAIYYAAETLDLDLTQREIRAVTHRSESTMREMHHLIRDSIEP